MPAKPPSVLHEHAIALARLLARDVARLHHAKRVAAGKEFEKMDRPPDA